MKNPIIIFGPNTYRSHKKLEKLLLSADLEPETYTGKDLDIGNFKTDLRSMPFLCDKKLVIVKDFFSLKKSEAQETLAADLTSLPDFVTLIFFENGTLDKRLSSYKKLKKYAEMMESDFMSDLEAVPWTKEYCKIHEIPLPDSLARFFVEYCGTDEWKLSSELTKLKSYAFGREITKTDIEELVTPSLSTTIFNMTDGISRKDSKSSIDLLHKLIDAGDPVDMIFHMIVRHFRILIQVKELVGKNLKAPEIAKLTGQNPYAIQKTVPQVRNFSFEKLKEIYERLLNIEIATKNGEIKYSTNDPDEFVFAIEKLILWITTT